VNVSAQSKSYFAVSTLALLLFVAGCSKKTVPTPAAPPPPPPAPTASISANPNTVDSGGTSQLTWRTENANDVTIEGVGRVDPNGSKEVTPTESTSYRLVAKGPGGTQDATARVTVNAPPPPSTPVTQPTPTMSDEQWFSQNVKDVYFDYDSYQLRADAQQSIAATARALAQKPGLRVQVQGHCDERGSTEYNLTLGDERATAVKNALVAAGVPASRIDTRTFGKEQPVCTESSEACWQQNRRAHFALNR
jgi:peptidoglycan-associated lipoprotein